MVKNSLLEEFEEFFGKGIDTSKNHLEDYWVNGHHQRHWVSNETGEKVADAYKLHKFSDREERYIHYRAKSLKEILKCEFNTLFCQKEKNFKVRFSKNSAAELGCDRAVSKSVVNGFSIDEHFEAAENIKSIYENSNYIDTFTEDKGNENVIDIKRFEKQISLSTGKNAYAYITVKNTKQGGNMLYSVELVLKKYPSPKTMGETSATSKK